MKRYILSFAVLAISICGFSANTAEAHGHGHGGGHGNIVRGYRTFPIGYRFARCYYNTTYRCYFYWCGECNEYFYYYPASQCYMPVSQINIYLPPVVAAPAAVPMQSPGLPAPGIPVMPPQ